ncbi:MAG: hypothetical protein ABJF10_05590 [Chthoniobacter sp.]|uniref:hypothetical protein n=1 Tax=Chthoniobacter sp. TaxID=2510640 RepID=UPI0032AC9F8B
MNDAKSPRPLYRGDYSIHGTLQRLLRLFVIVAVMAGPLAARADDSFAKSCARVVTVLRAGNWDALQKECAEEIVFERIQRIYLQDLTASESKRIFGPPGWISDDGRNAPATQPEDANDRDVLVTHGVLMKQKPSADEWNAFHAFCGYVRDSYDRGTPAVEWGRNARGEEVKSLFGPAIEGKVASNFWWRVQLEQIGGHWRVRKLITEMH